MSFVAGGGLGWQPIGATMPRPVVVRPMPPQWRNGSRFRKHLNGITTDATNTALASVFVEWFDVAADLPVGAVTSNALGQYDLPIYVDGTYQALVWKAGPPNVFGASDRVPAL